MTISTAARGLLAVLLPMVVGSCGALDVSDPTAIEDANLNNTAGAELLRSNALGLLYLAAGDAALNSALVSDEFISDWPSSGVELLDRRESEQFEGPYSAYYYSEWQTVRRAASIAIPKLLAYPGLGGYAHLGEVYAARGYAALRLAEDFCPGFPLHQVVDYQVVYGPPTTTDQAFEGALADFELAITYGVDSSRVLNLARIEKGRTLLGLGRFAEAKDAVSSVPTDYLWNAFYTTSSFGLWNPVSAFSPFAELLRSIGKQEGANGLDFSGAGDPRLVATPAGTAADGVTELYTPGKYPDGNAAIVLASGIEARLIEAEAALQAGDPAWLSILNALRATQGSPALPAITDPGTSAARTDVLFRERAFWLFGTGHRLADLRRLISRYGRPTETVFPTGSYRLGGIYGTATSIPFPGVEEARFSPSVTGCTSR